MSFVQRLTKNRTNNYPSSQSRKTKETLQKQIPQLANKKITDFHQHHSDLKSMLQMLEGQKTNSIIFTPSKQRQASKTKIVDKAKTQGTSTKENNNKKKQVWQGAPEKRLKIKFRNFEEDTNFLQTEKQTLLEKNIKFKNKTSKREQEAMCKSSINKPNSFGKRGIPNIGNTCYMNAVLQCLFHLKDFNPSLTCPYDEQKYPVTLKYLSLFNGVTNTHEKSPDLSTMPLKKSVSKMCCLFMDFEQQDAHQFLKQLLDSIHKEINRVRKTVAYRVFDFGDQKQNLQALSHQYWKQYKRMDDSYIYDSLCGQVCNFVTCINCKNTSINFDNFLDLSLPLVNSVNTLEGLLQQYFGEESLSDFYSCSKCGKSSKKSMKRSELWRCPNYLIIHLKRSQFGKKNNERIKIPVKCLNMKPFMSSTQKPVSCKYNLQGVVLHRGRSDGGHYWAHIKDGTNWFSADDECIKPQSLQDYEQNGSQNAYILFYRSI